MGTGPSAPEAAGDRPRAAGFSRRAKPPALESRPATRSRSRTPVPTPGIAEQPPSQPADSPGDSPAQQPAGGDQQSTGAALAQQAANGLARALDRRQRRVAKAAAAPEAGPSEAAAADGGVVIEMSDGSDGSEWEPDWQSDADEEPTSLAQEAPPRVREQEDGLLALQSDSDGLEDLPMRARQQQAAAAAAAAAPARPRGKAAAAKRAANAAAGEGPSQPAGGKGRKRKKAGAEPEAEKGKDSDDETWRVYGSEDEAEAPYVPTALEPMEPPAELLMELLPYQKEFLGWAVRQERGHIKGGILADEMGMGKTIQAISLIVTHRSDDASQPGPAFEAPAVPPVVAAAAARPRLRLAGAPPPLPPPAAAEPDCSPQEEWEDIEMALTEAPKPTVVPEDAGLAAAGAAPLGQPKPKPAAESPEQGAAQLPPHLETVMAVGDSGCGTGGAAAAAPAGQFSGATLVVCPVVAVIQWRQEIARYTAPGSLKVVVYHGSKRAASAEELAAADVVLTTYSIVEGEHRRHTQPHKAACTYCGGKFYPDRLKVHLRFFCGPNARKSDALAKQQRTRARPGQEGADASEADSGSEPDSDAGLPAKGKGKGGSKAKGKAAASGKGKASGSSKAAAPAKGSGKAPGKGSGKAVASGKGKGSGKAAAAAPADPKGKGVTKARKPAKGRPTKRRKKSGGGGGGSSGSDSDFSLGDESESDSESDSEADSELESESEAEAEAGTARGHIRPVKVRNGEGWEARALAEAEAMIAAAEKANSRAADVGASVLHEVRWRRIILDEAHCIKDRRCSTARAVFALDSKFKWALSGTPLQNRVSELYSLVRFLRLFPYAYYFCSQGHSKAARKAGKAEPCACKSLDYAFRTNWRRCDHCGHSPLHHYCYWNKWVANPIKKWGYVGKGRLAMRLLRTRILEHILLRRTKVQCADVLALPPRTVVLRKDRFDAREADFYEALYTQSQAQFDAYVQTSTVLNNYAHVFSLLVRLRQAVNHPYLVVHSAAAPGGGLPPAAAAAAAQAQAGECGLCHDPLEDGVAAGCGHAFCRACLREFLDSAAQGAAAKCPACSVPLTVDLAAAPAAAESWPVCRKGSILGRVALGSFQSSTKIEALREELERMRARDPGAKAIVFSQFTSMLDLIAFRLQQVGVRCVRLEGSQALEQRDRTIAAFTADAGVTVFLMSLKAGGVALNLTAASHVMLMDPWWNPAVEQQAQDRIHRLGQFKPIHVTRFVIGGTIEERILKLQEKKQLVFEGTVGRDTDALGRLTEDDLRFLFG